MRKAIPIDEDGAQVICAAIIKQAVDDWRYLVKTLNESKDVNFDELEHFFQHECKNYVKDIENADRIWTQMDLERRRSERR